MLNIPLDIFELIKTKNNILIAGIGGGFDVYGGLPVYYTLNKIGKNVHLANFSFTDFDDIHKYARPEIISPNILRANSLIDVPCPYYPEGYLSQWFMVTYGENIPVWMFKKTGVQPLQMAYKYLIDKLGIDMIILVDGGVDSINTGQETGSGTIMEDSISIAALSTIEGIDKIIMCVGFGTEVEEKVCGHNALMNMSEAIKHNGFYGSCSLVKSMKAYQFYKDACTYVFNLEQHSTSHIHRRIIPAVEGEFGDFHATDEDSDTPIFVSPLMPICWFFDFEIILGANKVVPYLMESISFFDAVQSGLPVIQNKHVPYYDIPY